MSLGINKIFSRTMHWFFMPHLEEEDQALLRAIGEDVIEDALSSVALMDRGDTLAAALPLLRSQAHPHSTPHLFEEISLLQGTRKEIIAQLHQLLSTEQFKIQPAATTADLCRLIATIRRFSPNAYERLDNLKTAIAMTTSLLYDCSIASMNLTELGLLLRATTKIDDVEWYNVVKCITTLCKDHRVKRVSATGVHNLLSEIKLLPTEKRNTVITRILELCLERSDGSATLDDIISFFYPFRVLSNENVEDVLSRLREFDIPMARTANVLEFLGIVAPKHRASLCENAHALLLHARIEETLSPSGFLQLLRILNAQRLSRKAQVMQTAQTVLQCITHSSLEQITFLIQAIHEAPQDQCADICRAMTNGSSKLELSRAVAIFASLPFIHPDAWEEFIQFVRNVSPHKTPILRSELIQAYIVQNPRVKEKIHAYLRERLARMTNASDAQAMASYIRNMNRVFQIDEMHPLFLDAVGVEGSIQDASVKNPYTLYRKHVEMAQKPPPEVPVVYQTIEGKTVGIATKHFQERAKQTHRLRYKDLPEPVHPEDLFQEFETRLSHLTAEERQNVEKQIREMTGSTFRALRVNFSGNSLNTLLVRGDPEDAAPMPQACFAQILHYITNLDNTDILQSGMTRREETLIQLSNSVQNCLSGKKEGIIHWYNIGLPEEYHFPLLETVCDPALQKAQEFIFQFLQNVLRELLSSEPFIQEFIKEKDPSLLSWLFGKQEPISELAHQSIYLKNALSHIIGYVHDIQFDPSTGMIHDALFIKEVRELLEIFYRHFTPELLINNLKEKVDRDNPYKTNMPLFSSLNNLVGAQASDWEVDEEDEPTGKITRKGAVDLLINSGYLLESGKRKRSYFERVNEAVKRIRR